MDSETNKGKSCFVHNDNKFREYYRKKNGHVCYRCTMKTCKARIEMRDVVIAEHGDHDHYDKVSNVAAVALRVSCKRAAATDLSQRLSKIIRTALQSSDVTAADDQVTSRDVVNCRAAMYRERRKQYGTLPKS